MKTQTDSKLMTLASTLGKPIAWVLRKQLGIVNWLVAKGWSKGLAKLMLKILNVFILVLALFILFPTWMALIAGFIALIGISGIEIEPLKQPHYRGGTDGFGLYDDSGFRVDGGSIDDEITYPKE